MPMTPMPALTLRHSTPHSNQNCGVRIAVFTCTWAEVTSGFSFFTAPEAGCQPAGGNR
jgi:hypothetical protein